MKIKSINLETVCGITSVLPKNELPEYAFAGKSNVGKSSLINALSNRKNYARTSSEPGKTQTINFYNLNDALYFVDLPGYGYAKVSRTTQEKWGHMIEKYLDGSEVLRRVFLLIDMRHEPSKNDIQMYEWVMASGYEPIVILTKADKLSKNEQFKMKQAIRKALGAKENIQIIPFSAVSKQGRDEIWELIDQDLSALSGNEETETEE